MVQSYFGKRKKVGFFFFFPPQSEKDSKTLVSSEIRPGWEPSYYKAKLKTLEAFSMTGRLGIKKGDGHFQVLEDNLIMSPEEVGSEFRRGVWGLRLDPHILSEKIYS